MCLRNLLTGLAAQPKVLVGIDCKREVELGPFAPRLSALATDPEQALLSDRGVPLEVISRLAGHAGTPMTEEVYRKQIRPVIQTGAVVMDRIFGAQEKRS